MEPHHDPLLSPQTPKTLATKPIKISKSRASDKKGVQVV